MQLDTNISFGQWVKQRRKWMDQTQAQLATLVDCAVITLQKIEANTLRPSLQTAKRLAAALQISSDDYDRFIHAARVPVLSPKPNPIASAANQPTPGAQVSMALFGREDDLTDLLNRIKAPEARLLTLIGPPGVGKTSLVRAMAERLRTAGAFPDGIFFVSLAEVQDPQQVAATLGRALNVTDTGHATPLAHITQALQHKRALLILDNFEHVLTATSVVDALLVGLPSLRVIITSRIALKLPDEQEFSVQPLALPLRARSSQINLARQSAAVAMFAEHAKHALPEFELSQANVRTVAEICIRLDGLPLAIELAAAKCRFLSPDALLQRLEHLLPLLQTQATLLPARQRRLWDAIHWSYHQLEPAAQQLFNGLGIFVGGWTAEATEAVFANSDNVLDLLAALLDNNLIVPRPGTNGVPRFGMLETLREFALEKLVETGQQAAIAQRHSTYFLHLARSHEMQMLSPRQAEVLALLDAEHDNFRAVLRWALHHDGALALELSGRLYFFWQLRSYCSEGRTWLQQALTLQLPTVTQDQKIDRARALYGFGTLNYLLSNYPEAKLAHEQALEIRQEMGDIRSQATLLNGLGQIADQQGRLSDAEALWQAGYALAHSIDDKPRMTATLSNLGELAYKRGDYLLARQRHADALALARLTGSHYNIALELHESGNVELKLGQVELARRYQEEGLVHARAIGDKNSEAFILTGLGDIALHQNDFERAEALYTESLVLRRDIDHKWGIGVSLTQLGQIAHKRGDRGHAIALLNESLVLLQLLGDKVMADTAKHWLTLAEVV